MLTTSGNTEGYVDTTNSAEAITALTPTSPTNVNFSRWVLLGPPATPQTSPVLVAAQGISTWALAFYDQPATGTVFYDSDNGNGPLGGATIFASGTGSTKSAADGTFTLAVNPGTVEISVTHAEYTTSADTVTIAIGQTITLEFTLTRLGTRF